MVDILNYEIPDNNFINYFNTLKKNGIGIFRALVTIIMYYIGYFLTNVTISSVDYVFTVSPELVKSIKKVYSKKTIDHTPSGVDSSFQLRFSNTKRYLGVYVGRITAQKGVYDLVTVWSKYVLNGSNAKLAIIGSADEVNKKLLEAEIYRLHLQKNVEVFFGVSNIIKNKLLSQSMVFLHLAKYEPLFPVIGILEGLSYGLPVISYDMAVIANHLKQDNLANFIYVVDNGNTNKVVSALKKYTFRSDKEKKVIFQNARKYAKNYDWDVIAAKEFNVIQQLIANSR